MIATTQKTWTPPELANERWRCRTTLVLQLIRDGKLKAFSLIRHRGRLFSSRGARGCNRLYHRAGVYTPETRFAEDKRDNRS